MVFCSDDTALDRVLEVMGEADFYRESHRKIFRSMLSLSEKREPIDLITLTDSLREHNELQDIGGATYLAGLVDRVPSAADIVTSARIVREKGGHTQPDQRLQRNLRTLLRRP